MRDREENREKCSGSAIPKGNTFVLLNWKREKKQEVTIRPHTKRDFLSYFPLHKGRGELVHSSAPGVGSTGRKRDSSQHKAQRNFIQ